jgi:uncharacterized protein (DUF1501 family)
MKSSQKSQILSQTAPLATEVTATVNNQTATASNLQSLLTTFSATEQAFCAKANYHLHPALLPLNDAFVANEIAFVLHTGSVSETRSHFGQQLLIESGSGLNILPTGFLAKTLGQLGTHNKAIALAQITPRSLKGADPALIDTFDDAAANASIPHILTSQIKRKDRLDMFRQREKNASDVISKTVTGAQQWTQDLAPYEQALHTSDTNSGGSDVRRRFDFAANLATKQTSTSSDGTTTSGYLNPSIIAIDIFGWDTHDFFAPAVLDHGGLGGKFVILADELSKLRATLKAAGEWENTVVVVMSEFGRDLFENASAGTDHGRASAMLIMGGGGVTDGGSNQWDLDNLDTDNTLGVGSAALKVKIDYRQVMAEVLQKHMGIANLATIFDSDFSKMPANTFKGFIKKG